MVLSTFDFIMLVLAILGALDKLILILDGFFNFLNDSLKGIFQFIDENANFLFWVLIIYLFLKLSGNA